MPRGKTGLVVDMTRSSLTRMVAVSGGLLALAAAAWLYMSGPSRHVSEAEVEEDLVVVPVDRPAPLRQIAPAGDPLSPSPEMKSALEIGDAARLRNPIPAELMGGIVCGEVSPTGNPADYRRFVYNGAGGTGGIDDGTEIFRKFADKICVMQPRF